jgi:hypothetical protein
MSEQSTTPDLVELTRLDIDDARAAANLLAESRA